MKNLFQSWPRSEAPPPELIQEAQEIAKLRAKILLLGSRHDEGLVTVDYEEWVGINCLIRDDEFPSRCRNDRRIKTSYRDGIAQIPS